MNTQSFKWTPIVNRRITVYRTYITARGSRDAVAAYLGAGCDYLTITENGRSSVYLKTEDTKKVSAIILEKIKQNPLFPAVHASDCLHGCAALVAAAEQVAAGAENLAAAELQTRLATFNTAYEQFAKFMAIPVAIERTITARITRVLEQKLAGDTSETLKKLMTTPKFSEFQKEEQALVRLAITTYAGHLAPVSPSLQNHAKNYAYLSCYNIDEPAYGIDYYYGRLLALYQLPKKELAEKLGELENRLALDEHVFAATVKELELTEEQINEIKLLREYVYLRTYRVEMQSKSNRAVAPLFGAVAKQLGVSLTELVALSPEEIVTALSRQLIPTKKQLATRAEFYGLRYDSAGIVFVESEKPTKALSARELGAEADADVAAVQGSVAYGGTCQARVRIVLTKKDIKNFKEGEILVTAMTTPEFVPAMKRAAAIITDEGGVLCHAAIVARELKVPCLIGTEKASRVFTTGDLVLVDGAAGRACKQ